MIKSKTINRRKLSKLNFLKKYFKYWKNCNELMNRYDIDNFDQNLEKFQKEIRNTYNIIACGKNTKLFWTQRGYTEKESKELVKPYVIKRDPENSPMNINYWIKKGLSEKDAIFNI